MLNDNVKKIMVDTARKHIKQTQEKISEAVEIQEERLRTKNKRTIGLMPSDVLVEAKLTSILQEQVEHLKQLFPSPYFTYCEFETDSGDNKRLYFGKFSFRDQDIYSWVTPIATLRFEQLGRVSYKRPDNAIKHGTLLKRDQYLIVDGKLVFLATEEKGIPRELVYQEHFSQKKEGFILPEVIEQMEKAQDQIIRAGYRGPLVISGPAGSGKTTLALHRVAFLMQSPDSAEYFPHDKILVFVQDENTKDYFSHLLPELGIKGVEIVTFTGWALQVLRLNGVVIEKINNTQDTNLEIYRYNKLEILKLEKNIEWKKGSLFSFLDKVYKNTLSAKEYSIFVKQKKEKKLDRIDLIFLLTAKYNSSKEFSVFHEVYEELKNGSYRKKKIAQPTLYNLLIIDEFQNYLPEELKILKSCLNSRLNSVVYTGDFNQQVISGSIKNWNEIDELVDIERMIILQKVYRNTKQILLYIRSLGYEVNIPEQLKEGEEVREIKTNSWKEEIEFITSKDESQDMVIGVLAFNENYLKPFKDYFSNKSNIHIMTISESQGVEFESTFLVGIDASIFDVSLFPTQMQEERKKMIKDLLYVGLTRAMSGMHVCGKYSLRELFKEFNPS